MISHKHKTIFIHVPKVAGISIEKLFLDDLGLDYNNRGALILGKNLNKSIGPPRISHLTAAEYIEQHYISKELYNEYFTFGFVRNPYNRVYSFYKYLGYRNLISFECFVLNYLYKLFQDKEQFYFVQPMFNYLYNGDELCVDYIGKLENINDDILHVFDRTSIKKKKLSHSNKSEIIPFHLKTKRTLKIIKKYPEILLKISLQKSLKEKVFTKEMKNKIYELYQKDFMKFNYQK